MENNTNTEVMPEGTGAPAEINTAAQDSINAGSVASPESAPAQPAALTYQAKLEQFKTLLEYFVYHLEYLVDEETALNRYANFIKDKKLPYDGKIPERYRCGNGFVHPYGGLQSRIKDWELFGRDKVVIRVDSRHKPNQSPTTFFLQWNNTARNIKADWEGSKISALYVCSYYEEEREGEKDKRGLTCTVEQLGLFEDGEPNQELKKFWEAFYRLLAEHKNWLARYQMTNELHELITNNKNLILTGAPGTGKTYLAKQLACKLVGAQSTDDDQYKNHVKFVQFHPSYDYTDFVEGLRPVKSEDKDGQLGFERKDGTFKELCLAALNAQEQAQKDGVEAPAFVMIIDEINRGQVSKIFGELFFALDPDYRGKEGKVETQYKNMVPDGDKFKPGFYVPENVYVIGTMNDIDHSLEPLDFAFRRRFAWREITASERFDAMFIGTEPFAVAPDFVEKVYWYFKRLNDRIENDPGFGAAYQIGPAYFLKLKNFVVDQDLNVMSDEDFKKCMDKLWNIHLKPLLQEYLKVNNDTSLTLKDLEAAYYGTDKKQG